jgi:hypothetical protein
MDSKKEKSDNSNTYETLFPERTTQPSKRTDQDTDSYCNASTTSHNTNNPNKQKHEAHVNSFESVGTVKLKLTLFALHYSLYTLLCYNGYEPCFFLYLFQTTTLKKHSYFHFLVYITLTWKRFSS